MDTNWEEIEKHLHRLTEREQQVALRRWQQGLTFAAIAKQLGISTERVRQIELRASKKMRGMLMEP